LVLRPKPRNHRGDFESQIIKPELSVLRPKPGNPAPPWFSGSTKKPTTDFEAKLGETIATGFEVKPTKTVTVGFEAKPLETVATGFEAKPVKTVATGFEVKPVKTVRVVLRPNHSQTVDLCFEAQPRNTRS
jgi:alkanesulfonate monooxygenase SsuD/methylene tetrahydromethanopterin reductase-like flavin-dependent oxidoreductase (luciferase family)